jgi:hypothetical protein
MSYDGHRANNGGLAVADRMDMPIRTIVPGLLLAFSAMAVRAQDKAPEATPPTKPAATQPSTPIDLSLHPAATQAAPPIDLSIRPAAIPPSTPIDLSIHPAAAPPSTPINLSTI